MREWLVTNGLGGYASLPVTNGNTRKFHGLLVASLEPPTKRWVFVSNISEKLHKDDTVIDLLGKGNFIFDLFPTFNYKFDGVHIKKTVLMPHEQNTTIIKYNVKTNKPVSLSFTPFVNSRHFYDVTTQGSLSFERHPLKHGISIRPNNIDRDLKIVLEKAHFEPNGSWTELQYAKDHERNDSWIDHAFNIGTFYKEIKNTSDFYLTFSIENNQHLDPPFTHLDEKKRKKQLLKHANLPHELDKLVLSTDNFIVKKDTDRSIIAGYHWFGVWGRDTLVALPGLTLVTRRYDLARELLLGLKTYCRYGLIPNAVMDRDSVAVYNTVDASLWYIDRVFQYLKYTDDVAILKKLWSTLQAIVKGYQEGTEYGIHMDNDHLISHGPGLTWMDVKIGDYYPTPRAPKAVEIQALWYNALRIMGILADLMGKKDSYTDLACSVKESFRGQFHHRYDELDRQDTSCRPNQIFLVSLDFSMIPKNQQKTIVHDVRDKLVTVFGLRTLSPDDHRYMGRYLGDYNRDITYHNGIVWPWLLGPFVKAFVKVYNYNQKWREHAYQQFLQPMIHVLGET
jgi:predicted glycogen debranching enzyme